MLPETVKFLELAGARAIDMGTAAEGIRLFQEVLELAAKYADKADAVYQGITPLVASDIAEVIGFVASRPSHVNLDQIIIKPRDQAGPGRFSRK